MLIGPSGSGKSTLLRTINLLEEPTEGQVFFEGQELTDIHTDLNAARTRMGMVFQQFNLFPHRTVHREHHPGPGEGARPERRGGPGSGPGATGPRRAGRQGRRLAVAALRAASSSGWPSPAPWRCSRTLMLFDEVTSALDPELVNEVLAGHAAPGRRGHDDGGGHPRDGLRPRGGRPGSSSWTRA